MVTYLIGQSKTLPAMGSLFLAHATLILAISDFWRRSHAKKMNTKTEGTLAIIAALIVLFSTMWNPWISFVVSMIALVVYRMYKFVQIVE